MLVLNKSSSCYRGNKEAAPQEGFDGEDSTSQKASYHQQLFGIL